MFGQIATFMENLHLSYTEVFEMIPYRNLIIMQKDKLHEATGDIVNHVSGREMLNKKIKK